MENIFCYKECYRIKCDALGWFNLIQDIVYKNNIFDGIGLEQVYCRHSSGEVPSV